MTKRSTNITFHLRLCFIYIISQYVMYKTPLSYRQILYTKVVLKIKKQKHKEIRQSNSNKCLIYVEHLICFQIKYFISQQNRYLVAKNKIDRISVKSISLARCFFGRYTSRFLSIPCNI